MWNQISALYVIPENYMTRDVWELLTGSSKSYRQAAGIYDDLYINFSEIAEFLDN